MSPRNWAHCPECRQLRIDRQQSRLARARASYGPATQDKYSELMAAATKPEAEDEPTLREEYKIGVDPADMMFIVDYSCNCTKCGFRFATKYTRREEY